MILIADSGSTKCDWVLLDENSTLILKTQTPGLNPNQLTTHEMHRRIAKSPELSYTKDDVRQIFFFGAGCGSDSNRIKIKRFLEKYFKNSKSRVYEDIMGACFAVTKEPSIVCILGTGSNSCYFDGENQRTNAPSLGYSIMDEASGNYFGKRLLNDYFYGRMPEKHAKKFKKKYDLNPDAIRESLYKKENPNAYLATFARFMFRSKPIPPYFKEMIAEGFGVFVENRILPYPEAKSVPIHFAGSIAHSSKAIIQEVLESYGLTCGVVTKNPIYKLYKYIKNEIKSQ